MFDIKLTEDKKSIASLNVTLGSTPQWAGVMVPSTRPYFEEANMFYAWGVIRCQVCRERLWVIDEPDKALRMQGLGCQFCMSVALRARLGGEWQWFDNFSNRNSFMPRVSRSSLNIGAFPVVAAEGLMGWPLSAASWTSLYPYGWASLARIINGGTSILLKLAGRLGLCANVTSQWPSPRMALYKDWFVMDTRANPYRSILDPAGYFADYCNQWLGFKTSPLAYSANNGIAVIIQMQRALTEEVGTKEQKDTLLAYAKELGFLQQWDKDAWQARVAKELAPFGDPTRVLRPGKVLRAGR